jgi:hypothetical protein
MEEARAAISPAQPVLGCVHPPIGDAAGNAVPPIGGNELFGGLVRRGAYVWAVSKLNNYPAYDWTQRFGGGKGFSSILAH